MSSRGCTPSAEASFRRVEGRGSASLRSILESAVAVIPALSANSSWLAEDKVRTYGVADMSILRSAKAESYLVLTEDGPLTNYLNKVEVATLSLSEIKNA